MRPYTAGRTELRRTHQQTHCLAGARLGQDQEDPGRLLSVLGEDCRQELPLVGSQRRWIVAGGPVSSPADPKVPVHYLVELTCNLSATILPCSLGRHDDLSMSQEIW